MLMVLTLHCLAKSGALYEQSGSVNVFYWILESLCIPAVDLFMLITGYFSVNARFRSRNIWRVLVIVWSYSFLTSLLNAQLAGYSMTAKSIMRMLIPIISQKYWFVNAWLALAVISPFLSRLITALSKAQYRFLLCFLLLFMVLRPTLFPREWAQDPSTGQTVFFFIVLYFLAGWLRLYVPLNQLRRIRPIILRCLYLVLAFVLAFSRLLMLRLNISEGTAIRFYGYDSVIVVLQAVTLILLFLVMKPLSENTGRIVNALSKNSFAVYVIHFSLNPVLWRVLLPTSRYVRKIGSGFLAIFFSVCIVYLICIMIEELRLQLFALFPINTHLESLFQKWDALFFEDTSPDAAQSF